jgi:hypothetical protein
MSFLINIRSTTPKVTNFDIRNGYMPRYFACKANQLYGPVENNIQSEGIIYEISRRDYERYTGVRYVILGHLNWVIRGKLEDRESEVMLYTGHPALEKGREPIVLPGVLTQNEASVMFLSRKLPAIKSYLRKYDQFYVGE